VQPPGRFLQDGPKATRGVRVWVVSNGHWWQTTNRAGDQLGVFLMVNRSEDGERMSPLVHGRAEVTRSSPNCRRESVHQVHDELSCKLVHVAEPVSAFDCWLRGAGNIHIHMGTTRADSPTIDPQYLCARIGPNYLLCGEEAARDEIPRGPICELGLERPKEGQLDGAVFVLIRELLQKRERMKVSSPLTRPIGLRCADECDLPTANPRQAGMLAGRGGFDGVIEACPDTEDRKLDRSLFSSVQHLRGSFPRDDESPGDVVESGPQVVKNIPEDDSPLHICRLFVGDEEHETMRP
jgi:hypothetical protein